MKSNSPKISFNTGAHDGNPAPDAEAVPRAPRLLAAKLSESGSAAFDAPRYVTAGFAPAKQPGPVQRNDACDCGNIYSHIYVGHHHSLALDR